MRYYVSKKKDIHFCINENIYTYFGTNVAKNQSFITFAIYVALPHWGNFRTFDKIYVFRFKCNKFGIQTLNWPVLPSLPCGDSVDLKRRTLLRQTDIKMNEPSSRPLQPIYRLTHKIYIKKNTSRKLATLRSFQHILVISGRWEGDTCNGRLCAMEPHLRLKRVPPPEGVESGTAKSADKRWAVGAPLRSGNQNYSFCWCCTFPPL